MTNLAVETWIFFAIWLVIGVVIYFAYGQRHSRLNEKFAEAKAAVNGAPQAVPGKVAPDDQDEDRAHPQLTPCSVRTPLRPDSALAMTP